MTTPCPDGDAVGEAWLNERNVPRRCGTRRSFPGLPGANAGDCDSAVGSVRTPCAHPVGGRDWVAAGTSWASGAHQEYIVLRFKRLVKCEAVRRR